MKADAAAALRARLEADTDADLSTLRTTTDKSLAIGTDVWRLLWRRQPTAAVAADAGLHTTCGAVLDVLALLEHALAEAHDAAPTLDISGVNVLVDRSMPTDDPTECDQALRSMRDATKGIARIWYRRGDVGWQEDRAPAPTWPQGDQRVDRWLHEYLLPRLDAAPGPLALALVAAVGDQSFHLYPSEILAGRTDVWALRLDGLQIGKARPATATLTIGKSGKAGDGPQRKVFTEVFGQPSVTVSSAERPPPGELTVAGAADGIRTLLRRFRDADVCGAPISHRMRAGVRVIDEHTLEARLLKGLCQLDTENELVGGDTVVARGSQFPTLWCQEGKVRYLDALVCRGAIPLAVELKVATGGQGRYYRRSLVQAVLYRHFIRNAPGLDPWFEAAGLDRMATEGSIGLPIPPRWTPGFGQVLDRLTSIAERVGAQVHVLDDRVTPDWVAVEGLSEPSVEDCELLSWRMAAALSSRWPRSLGRVVERNDCGGFYDQLQLQGVGSDRMLDPPFPRPRVTLNRPGSLRVWSQRGSERWTWREIWSHLAHGADPGQAAVTVGAIAGMGRSEPASAPCFAEVALAFLEAANDAGWTWRCAWPGDGEVSPWVEQYGVPLRRYSRTSAPGVLPTIARIWGAIREGEAAVIVDQENLRAWVEADGRLRELQGGDPVQRVVAMADLQRS